MAEKLRLRSNGNGDVYIYIEDSSNASFAAGGDIANAVFAMNVSTSSDIEPDGTTAQITLDPAANGNITFRPRGTGDSLFNTGDIDIVAGNLNLPSTSSTAGQVTINSNRFMHAFGTDNTFVGENSGNFTLSGQGNCSLGTDALQSLTTAIRCIGIGDRAAQNVTSGTGSIAIGFSALDAATTGVHNTAIGTEALGRLGTGARNTALGYLAGNLLTGTDSSNIMIGNEGTAGDNNTIRIGWQGTGLSEQDTTFIAGIYNTTPAGGNDGMVIIDSNGQLGSQVNFVMPENPAFLAYNSVTDTNVTGNATIYTVNLDTEVYDQGGDFAADTFTAPVTGKYFLAGTISIIGLTVSHTDGQMRINTSNAAYYAVTTNWGASMTNNTAQQYSFSVVADMDAADTATLQVAVSNGTQVVDVAGTGSPLLTRFSGVLVS